MPSYPPPYAARGRFGRASYERLRLERASALSVDGLDPYAIEAAAMQSSRPG